MGNRSDLSSSIGFREVKDFGWAKNIAALRISVLTCINMVYLYFIYKFGKI
jgi:hypothetical protein